MEIYYSYDGIYVGGEGTYSADGQSVDDMIEEICNDLMDDIESADEELEVTFEDAETGKYLGDAIVTMHKYWIDCHE